MRIIYIPAYLLILNYFDLISAQNFGFRHSQRNVDDFIAGGSNFKFKGKAGSEPGSLFFEQKLEHFPPGKQTWKQRYGEEKKFYGKNGVVFLYVAGEWTMRLNTLQKGLMYNLAEKYKAFMFTLEHRFYGESKPLPDVSVKSLHFLSIDLALADTAYFIKAMNKKHKFGPKPVWIVFGGSYAGTMAHWLRFKYPDLVFGALASSAPLLAKLDFPEYLGHVEKVLSEYNPQCTAAIKAATEKLTKGLYNAEERTKYKKMFSLCNPLTAVEKDLQDFYGCPLNTISGAVQYDSKAKSAYTDVYSIRGVCTIMTDKKIKDPLDRYAKLVNLGMVQDEEKCVTHGYKSMIDEYKETAYTAKRVVNGARQWFYQTCVEFGWYQIAEKKGSTFGDKQPLNFSTQMCVDIFGDAYNEAVIRQRIKKTNEKYRALANTATRVIIVHGSVDPWSRMGITKSPPAGTYLIVIKDASHCADLRPDSPDDVPDMKRAREKITKIIGDWVKEGTSGGKGSTT